jgi:TolB-like protein
MKRALLAMALSLLGAFAFSQESPRIAVFPFEDLENLLTRNESVLFYRQFSNEFANKNSGRFTIVPRQDVDKLINTEARFQLSDFSAKVKTAEMNEVLNGTRILSGLIGKVGNRITISVSLYNYPNLSQLPGGVDLRVANKDELFDKIPELVQMMMNAIAGVGESTGGAAQTSTPEGLLYEIVDRKSVTITKYIGNAATVNIPSHILDFPVTSIGDSAFSSCESLTSITIPSSVTSIEYNAFWGCSSLTSITVDNRNPVYASADGVLFDRNKQTLLLYSSGRNQGTYVVPSSVTTIGKLAFSHCSSLTSITIPSSVTSIGDYTFDSCESLTSITVDNRNPVYASVDGVLFDKKIRTLITYPRGKNQKTYVIPSSVTTIEPYAFQDCNSLTSITIPSSVTTIGYYAFFNCSLTSVTIPNGVTKIEYGAFAGNQLTSVSIPNSVTYIGGSVNVTGAFSGNRLTSVTIPSSVTYIGDGAFNANQLTSITIPSSITYILDYAFSNNQLTSVTIPNSVTTIGWGVFKNNKLTSVTIPNSVTSIGNGAFADNQLTSITIGANVELYDDPFDNGFAAFYNAQYRMAGTYTYRNGSWTAQTSTHEGPRARLSPSINPDPNRIYRLRVGSYYSESDAADACAKLLAVGLKPAYEYSYNSYRVLVVGVRGTDVISVTEKLFMAGFMEAFISE